MEESESGLKRSVREYISMHNSIYSNSWEGVCYSFERVYGWCVVLKSGTTDFKCVHAPSGRRIITGKNKRVEVVGRKYIKETVYLCMYLWTSRNFRDNSCKGANSDCCIKEYSVKHYG